MVTKEQCKKALNDYELIKEFMEDLPSGLDGIELSCDSDELYDILNSLIEEHFDNPPLTVADIPLEEEIMCWDNAEKEWCSIYSEGGEVSIAYFQLPTVYTMYETFDKKHGNRFYRKEVHE